MCFTCCGCCCFRHIYRSLGALLLDHPLLANWWSGVNDTVKSAMLKRGTGTIRWPLRCRTFAAGRCGALHCKYAPVGPAAAVSSEEEAGDSIIWQHGPCRSTECSADASATGRRHSTGWDQSGNSVGFVFLAPSAAASPLAIIK